MFSDQKIVAVGGLVLPKEKSFVTSFLFGFYDFFLRLNQLCGVVLPWGNNLVIRKNILYEVGGFNKTLSTSEDWELAIRIKRKIGRKSKVIYNTNLVVYTSTRKHQNKGVFLKYVVEGIDNYFNVVILGRAKTSQMRNVR